MLEAIVAMLQLIGTIMFQYYGWVLVVAFLGYLIWQNRRKTRWVEASEHILLQIEVPKENEKKELSAEQMFASLHGILRSKAELKREGSLQEHLSFEIAAIDEQIRFYVWVPKHLKDFVEGQIYAQYPSVHIVEGTADYTARDLGDRQVYGTELALTKSEVLPIKTFPSFEVDPLAGITAVLSKLDQGGEEMWAQVLVRPVDDVWQQKGFDYIDQIKNGKSVTFVRQLGKGLLDIPIHVGSHLLSGLSGPSEPPEKKDEKKELSTGQQAIVKAIEEKVTKLGFEVKIRIVYVGRDDLLAKQRMQAVVGGFKQFNTTNLNGFTTAKTGAGESLLQDYRARLFLDSGYILNIEEVASLYHLPHKSVETPNMVWVSSKTAEPPANLPTPTDDEVADISLFGLTNFRGQRLKFGMKRADRGRHLYIVGQTGTGKSQLLQLLALSDLYHNEGLAIIDPHGDLAIEVMQYIPEHRINDVVYFNPTDRDFPIAFNPMEVSDPSLKHDTASELVGVMKRMFESWGPRLEHILRFTILALLDHPDATMLDITRMLTEKEFRKRVVRDIDDPVVKAFWVNEFASWNDKFANEAVAPVLNKVGAFIANPLIRNVIGQPKSTINLRKLMDEGKILIVNLSHGQIGEVNAGILGALVVTSIQIAAMSRANVPKDERRPFYLYVDEFQNFATDSFAVILSEARKYNLCLTVANQFIAQMPETVREAVFGNVGSMITFRVGAGDSAFLAKYFEPTFEGGDLVRLNNREMFITMSIDGEKAQPFSGRTLSMPAPGQDLSEQIIAGSRQRYATNREEVEDKIRRATLGGEEPTSGGDQDHQIRTPDEQKPNTFLSGLKNPSGHSSGPRRHSNQGRQESGRRRPQTSQSGNRTGGLSERQLGIRPETETETASVGQEHRD
ncbi:MAG TPA: type IV secretion system DNA-binding domain-containing protein [Candidatus Saccharimonadales bacterium]|nr:type IV secretion system DNA-binding domain-containing protein [Candidatus Saccharimonadales bacterium]